VRPAASAESARVRGLRPARRRLDPWVPAGVLVEHERGPDGQTAPVVTVFLTGAECPFTCVFCDLWQHTLESPTPPGALPTQLRLALSDAALRASQPRRIKLYNASNFFEPRAVPSEDLPALAELLRPFEAVTVESHPRLVGETCLAFAERIDGRLEVAMGLETIHPQALMRLNKQTELADFSAAAALLRRAEIGVRAFVLVGAPFVPTEETVAWAVRSAAWALEQGAALVALIPVRSGNGELERLASANAFAPPSLAQLEATLEQSLGLGMVLADLWDAARLPGCTVCHGARVERLARMNLSGRPEPALRCAACAGSASAS